MKNQMDGTTTQHGRAARLLAAASFAALLAAAPFRAALAQTAPPLGAAGSYGILANETVTCTDSVINGDLGSNTAVVQTRCTVNGSVHTADGSAAAAYADFLVAYDAFAALSEQCTATLSGTLADVTLPPGIYCFEAAATLTGLLKLDGPADGVWIFLVGTGGTGALTGTNFSVVMNGGGQPCNVYWWVAEATTMTTSNFVGTILAGAASTFTGGSFIGRDLAKAAVTLTGATASACTPGTPPTVCWDFVTGGGWIRLPDGSKGTFAVSGGIKHGDFWGHLNFVDHGSRSSKLDARRWRMGGASPQSSARSGMTVKGTGVTAYTVVDATTRHIEGTARINGVSGTYEVDVMDAGEPGRGDTFDLRLSNGYTASGHLDGGNIQLHQKCRPMICIPSGRDDDDDDDDEEEGH